MRSFVNEPEIPTAQQVAKLKWQSAGHIARGPMDVEITRCWNGDLAHSGVHRIFDQGMHKAVLLCMYEVHATARTGKRSVDRPRGGQTTSNESMEVTGNKQSGTVDFGSLYKIPMSSSGRQSVEVMMMVTGNYVKAVPPKVPEVQSSNSGVTHQQF
ncbi:jg26209 [Pararge aegeria aegeria]|uniref:Jg26209 protein n=1 Tax=Pararge aegeria aegeria TaxID=348720 RepID=A0A8S4SFH2_9NEOP|nr:jg26209 [Pararge aegeria aegeria]